ncbi:MAG TPA: nuclear transport factor 2 family protein [Croceibacterium sp.]|nr:nuclear transport factor 2 family protein [Croceibacterium sp.]
MTEDDFRTYIAAFNARDFAGFSRFYADDVEFNLGDRKQIVGAQGIVDFYTGVFEHIAEELDVVDLIVAPDGAALHSRTTFTTVKDWPDFEIWPTMKGDVRVVESINMYRTKNGKIVQIKSGRYSSK